MTSVRGFLRISVISQQIRFYPRWSHRRPVKIYSPEEYENIENPEKSRSKEQQVSLFDKYKTENNEDNKIKWATAEKSSEPIKYSVKIKKNKPLIANQQNKKTSVDMLETVIDKDGNFIYTKMGNSDSRVGQILTLVKNRKEQEIAEIILLEGKRLIKDALQSGCPLKYILFSRTKEVEYLKPFLPKMGAQLYKMPYREMQIWSDLTTNPGIMGIFKVPNVEKYEPIESVPLTIICDNVREPGNLGTILRICAGVGVRRVFLTKGCVNLWDTKVLRSAAGAHFKLNIRKSMDWEQIQQDIKQNSDVYIADNRIISEVGDDNNTNLEEIVANTPVLPYYGVNFKTAQEIVLVVGGETEGVSLDSYNLAVKSNGVRLNIPLCNSVDSLNVGAALGIIAFEIKRQLIKS